MILNIIFFKIPRCIISRTVRRTFTVRRNMAESKSFDIVVFGASGFTGKYVVEEIARTASEEKGLKWAIAGRKMKKLQEVLDSVSKLTGQDLTELPIIIADVNSENSLKDMCKQTKVLVNCVGPYRFYGTPVVQACIQSRTHHVDISGETEWLERIQLNLNKDAQDKEVFVIQACGFDSIPAELGLLYTKQQFQGELNSVESYISFNAGEHGGCLNEGTWKSAIHSLSNKSELRALRERLYPQSLPTPRVKLQKRSCVFFSRDVNRWCIPFLGTDKSVVLRTSYFNFVFNKEMPVQFQPYMALSGFGDLISWLFVGLILTLFTKTRLGIYLLETFPRALSLGKFSSTGPTRQQTKGGSFEMTFLGEGFSTGDSNTPDKKIITRIRGPDAGYVATSTCLVQAAYVVLKEDKKMPTSYGVLTPGRAFLNTSLLERLQKHNIIFSTV